MPLKSIARLSVRSQITMPKRVLDQLGIGAGDFVVFAGKNGDIVLHGLQKAEADAPFGVFTEWASEADEDAYSSL